jgi:hexosaminidase
VQQYVDSFKNIRQNVKAILSETQILNNPTDYKPDQNHHAHLANGTVNSDWMYLYELPMNTKIREWLSGKSF